MIEVDDPPPDAPGSPWTRPTTGTGTRPEPRRNHDVAIARIECTLPPMGIDHDAAGSAPTYRYGERKADYRARLRRIEGQVRGISRMVESDTYCIDVLTQIAAAKRALESVAVGLLDDHLRGCVTDAARDEDPRRADEIIAEATAAIERLVRS